MKRWLFGILATLALAPTSQAFAQDAPAEVVVLRFANTEVDQAVMDQFYTELHGALESTDEMTLAPGGEVTIDDLVMMGGCSTPDAACLAGLQDFVAGERLVYGSIERSEDVHMFSIYLFDFASGEFVQQVEEKTLRGDAAWLAAGIPAVVEHFVFGESAQVEVQIAGAPTADVLINGQEVGQGSQTLEGVAPGETVVTARRADGEQMVERVILRRGENPPVRFAFDAGIEEPPAVASQGSMLPGVGVAALGVAGIVLGFVGQSQLGGLETQAEDLVAGRNALSPDQVGRASDLQSQMDSAHTMRVVGFSVGGLALAAGGYMIVRSMGASSDESDALSWDVGVGRQSVGAKLRLKF